jgi:dihydrofolate reductase
MIVARSRNHVIGKDNQMPWKISADLQFFKKVTMGYPIIMGRKTWESIGRPLPGRRNIVVSRNSEYQAKGAELVSSLDQALPRGPRSSAPA